MIAISHFNDYYLYLADRLFIAGRIKECNYV
jgi:hypothetical protein